MSTEAAASTRALFAAPIGALTVGIIALMTLAAFEGVSTSTAMPVVARDLDALGEYTWAFTANVAASLLGMVLAGIASDARGPRLPIIGALVGFVGGSVVCALSPSLFVLVVGRAIQGVGAGALIVSIYVLIARAYPEQLRPMAFSILSAAWVVPSLIGPVIAGWLAEEVSWRAIFWIVPIFAIPAVLLLGPHLRAYDEGTPQPGARGRIGAGVAAAAGLVLVQDGVLRAGVIGVATALIGIVLVVIAWRTLLPTGALRLARGLPMTVLMRGLVAGGYFSAEIFVPLALVESRGVTVTQAGLMLALTGITWFGGSWVQGRIAGNLDRARTVRIGTSFILVALLTLPIAVLTELSPFVAAASLGLGAFGMGLTIPSIAVQTMRLSPVEDQGANSAALQIADSSMVVIFTALVGVIHASAEARGDVTGMTFAVIFACAAALVAIGWLAAGRMRPAEPAAAPA